MLNVLGTSFPFSPGEPFTLKCPQIASQPHGDGDEYAAKLAHIAPARCKDGNNQNEQCTTRSLNPLRRLQSDLLLERILG